MKNILITGGAGFLGLNIALEYLEKGNHVVIVDDLKNSYVAHIHNLMNHYKSQVTFYKGDVCKKSFIDKVFKAHHFDTVLHLAALKNVAESKERPDMYRHNNITSLKNILSCIDNYGCEKFAFPSTAVVYGNTNIVPIHEDVSLNPLSPYAETKVMGEKIITDWHSRSNIPTIVFRFGNPVGANTEYMFGDHSKRGYGNLIPYIISHALSGKTMTFKGNDHTTPDGTAIRDYVHVKDLAYAVHKVLVDKETPSLETINVGSGKGYSVLEIVHTVENVLGTKLDYVFAPKNNFESSVSILDISKLQLEHCITFSTSLEDIVKSEIQFYQYLNKECNNEDFSR